MSETYLYGNALVRAFTDLAAGGGAAKTWKVMLLTDSYDFDPFDVYASDVSAAQATGTGYSAGGITMTGVTIAYDADEGVFNINADDLLPVGMSVSARWAVVYLAGASLGVSPLITATDLTEADEETDVTGLSIHPLGLFTGLVPLPSA